MSVLVALTLGSKYALYMQTTSAPRYNTDFHPTVGKTEALAPGIKRIVAPNPSAYTFTGTNTYIVGFDDVIVVDPGPRQ